MDVRFVILSASGKHRATTKRLPILVGRSEEARLRITQDCVSRRHCEFLEQDGQVFVRDLESTNGTLLEDEEIPANVPTLVRPGGVVKVGGVALRIEYESADVVGDTRPPAEGDTVPLADGVAAAATDAVADDEAADEVPDAAAPAPDEASAADAPGGFGFLAGGPAADAAAEGPEWPANAEPAEPDDGDLDNFFKSLK